MTDKMREAFEKIAADYGRDVKHHDLYVDEYASPGTERAWFEFKAGAAWQAARMVPEGMMVVSAKWLERHAGPEDHACIRCYPHSDMIVDGFSCYYHKACDVLSAAPEGK